MIMQLFQKSLFSSGFSQWNKCASQLTFFQNHQKKKEKKTVILRMQNHQSSVLLVPPWTSALQLSSTIYRCKMNVCWWQAYCYLLNLVEKVPPVNSEKLKLNVRQHHSKETILPKCLPQFFLFKSLFSWFSRNRILKSYFFPSDLRCHGLADLLSLSFKFYLIFFPSLITCNCSCP